MIGRPMRRKAVLPDKTEKRLPYAPDRDFNWQPRYAYKQPLQATNGAGQQGLCALCPLQP